jgi:hypothetical protein
VLKYHRKSAAVNFNIHNRVLSIMIPAFFIHLLMNMWLLTSYTIFPENYTSTEVDIGGTATTIFVGEEVSAFKRVSSIINFE